MTIDRKSLGTQTFSEDSDLSKASYLEMGNQELVLAPPTTTQYFLNEEPQVREYFLDETARALAAWSCLDTFPRKYLPLIFEPPFGDSQSSSRSESSTLSYQRDFPEPGSDSDFESPSIPPSPSNPAALNKTWEQVRANNSKGSKVSVQTESFVSYHD